MAEFLFKRSETENARASIGQQTKAAEEVLNRIKGYIPKVESAWTGGDEKEFEADVQRKLVPAMTRLMVALVDFTGVMGKIMDLFDQKDNQVKGMVGKLADQFTNILK